MSNNPVYTYHEKQHFNLGGNSRKRKVGIESLRRFDHCALCLGVAREATSTPRGIIYCKECIYADLLAQKQEIKAAKTTLKQLKQAQKDGSARRAEISKQGNVERFDKAQKLGGDNSQSQSQSQPNSSSQSHPTLPSFWLSSLQPNISDEQNIADRIRALEAQKMVTLCRQANPPHPLTLKDLTPVKIKYTDSARDVAVCSGCNRTLNNSTRMLLTKSCHNLLCGYCIDTLYTPSQQCPVCDEKVDTNPDDLIRISVEGWLFHLILFTHSHLPGTGFAGGGGVMLKKRTGTLGLN